MTDEQLRPATRAEIVQALAYALRFDQGKPVLKGLDFIARLIADDNAKKAPRGSLQEELSRVVADRLAAHMELSGFVVLKKPPMPRHTNTGMVTGIGGTPPTKPASAKDP